MEINKIQHFRLVYELESVRSAASILGMTPGALSKSIKTLEEETGDDLFVPRGRNIIASKHGHFFYRETTDLIQSFSRLKSKMSEKRAGQYTLATWEVFSTYVLSEFFCQHSQKLEQDEIQLIERTPHFLEQALLKGEADIGITYEPIPHPDLHFQKIATFSYGAFAVSGKFDNRKIADIPFAVPITLFPSSPTGVQTLDNWPEGIERKTPYRFEMLESALLVAGRGLAAVYLPSFVIHFFNSRLQSKFKLCPLEIDEAIPEVVKGVFLASKKDMPRSQLYDDLVSFISKASKK